MPDVLVLHRDADTPGVDLRRAELVEACEAVGVTCPLVPIVPVRMTEAWLLLDPQAITVVAGDPRGGLRRPSRSLERSRLTDPQRLLQESLLTAADAAGRRRDQVALRSPAHRRQLIERRARFGAVAGPASLRALTDDIARVVVVTSGTARGHDDVSCVAQARATSTTTSSPGAVVTSTEVASTSPAIRS